MRLRVRENPLRVSMRVVNSLDSTAKKVDPPYSSNRSLIYPFWAKGYPSRTTHPRSLAALLGTLGHMIFCLPGSPFLALFLHVSPCSWKPLTWRPFWSCHYTPWNHGSGKPPPVVFQGAMPSSSMMIPVLFFLGPGVGRQAFILFPPQDYRVL